MQRTSTVLLVAFAVLTVVLAVIAVSKSGISVSEILTSGPAGGGDGSSHFSAVIAILAGSAGALALTDADFARSARSTKDVGILALGGAIVIDIGMVIPPRDQMRSVVLDRSLVDTCAIRARGAVGRVGQRSGGQHETVDALRIGRGHLDRHGATGGSVRPANRSARSSGTTYDRCMWKQAEPVGWLVGLLAVGEAGVLISRATAPPETQGDMWDSSLMLPLLVVVAVVCAVAGYRVPAWWFLYGVAAIAPYFVTQIVLGQSDDSGLWGVGLLFLVPLSAIPVLGSWLGRLFRTRHAARR